MLSTIINIENVSKKKLELLKDFEFNWSLKANENTHIFCAEVLDNVEGLVEFERLQSEFFNFMHLIEVSPKYRGTTVAGELLAFVGLDSLNSGFDGFVVFESKSLTYNYYIEKYGAKPIYGRRLHFDFEATKNLIKTYLEVK